MQRSLTWIGVVALALWTVGGAFAWWRAAGHWTIVVQEGASEADASDPRVALLDERVQSLAADVRALAPLLEQNLVVLDERGDERARELRARFDSSISELAAGLDAELQRAALRTEALAAAIEAHEPRAAEAAAIPRDEPVPDVAEQPAPPPAAEETPAVVTPDAPSEPEVPAPRASFLAFRLPSDDFRFDERRTWTVVPALSRVGFDGKSTLHDFSGTTSAVSGGVTVELAHPERAPSGRIEAQAASLDSGDDGRDEGLRENLAVETHPQIVFELASFEPQRVDAIAGRVAGLARGRMRIRGVERELALPVALALDDAHLLSIDGEVELALPDYDVPVPSKLGLIRMDERVRVWIALRARLEPKGVE